MKTLYITFLFILFISFLATAQDTTFTEVTTINLTGVSHSSSDWGDYDSDGDLDILITGYIVTESIAIDKIYRNEGNDTFVELTSLSTTGVYEGATAWGDYDNDGDLDILLTGNTGSTRVSRIYRNEGGSFIEQTSISLIGVDRSSVAWGDYDNDGDLDILLSGASGIGSVAKIYRNEGNNIFNEQSSINITGTQKSSVGWGDYDNDGDLDFLITGHGPGVGGQFSRIYRNEGDNSFAEQTSISLTDVGASAADWGDYDNDGDLDILLTGYALGGEVSKIYRNEGNNTFAEQTSISLIGVTNTSAKSSLWGDYDNDGDLDIILTGLSSSGKTSTIYRNNGDNTFTEMTSFLLTPVYDCSVAWGDYDNDNDLDLIITGSTPTTSRSAKIYKNNSENPNTLPISPTNLISITDSAGVTLSWNKSTDNETPQDGLKYNIVIGTNPGEMDIVSPMSDLSTGYRRVVDMGNTNHNNSWKIKGLAPGNYYWSVQAIDNNFAGSNFSAEHSFTLSTTPEDWVNQILVADAGGIESSEVLVFGQHPNATDSIDASLGEYELPPPPPQGIFDVRFILPTIPEVSSVKDLRASSQTEITWTMTFQTGIAGYPMNFEWSNSSFPQMGNFFLKDLFGLINVNMRTQSSYTLTNPAISSLQIEFSTYTREVNVLQGWNILSVPVQTLDMAANTLFPGATTYFFGYNNGYQIVDTLENGRGYWTKFDSSQTFQIVGNLVDPPDISVYNEWNLIGPFDFDVLVSDITSTPPNIIVTNFFGFNNGYQIADTLKIGKGYWVRVNQNGTLHLNNLMNTKANMVVSEMALVEINFTITDGAGGTQLLIAGIDSSATNGLDPLLGEYEIPPPPPAGVFDARFNLPNSTISTEIDIREGTLTEGFEREHQMQYQVGAGTEIIINYDFGSYDSSQVKGRLQDIVTGTLIDTLISGVGSYTVQEPSVFNKLNLTLIYVERISTELEDEVNIPNKFALNQNFPNPFNPNTLIRYDLPEDKFVSLKVFDVLGKEVVILVNNENKAGSYEIDFNASHLPSGVYFCRLQAGSFVETKKMILLK